MAIYTYISQPYKNRKKCILKYASIKKLRVNLHIEDKVDLHIPWNERALGNLIEKAKKNDTIIFFDAPSIVCSSIQLIKLLIFATRKKIQIVFTKYRVVLSQFEAQLKLMSLIKVIKKDFKVHRSKKGIKSRKKSGLPFGKPMGKKNNVYKLDKFKKTILSYLNRNYDKQKISQKLGCSHATLSNWLKKNGITINQTVVISKPLKPKRKKYSKLDIYEDKILKYLNQNYDRKKISKKIGCSHQLLNHWLKIKGISVSYTYHINPEKIIL